MNDFSFQYYDGLAWIGPLTFEQLAEKIEAKVITKETWIIYGTEPRIKAGHIPGLFPDAESSDSPHGTSTVNLTEQWIRQQTGMFSAPQPDLHASSLSGKPRTNAYEGFFVFAEKLNEIFWVYILISCMMLGMIGLLSFAAPQLAIGLFAGLINLVMTIWICRVVIPAVEGHAQLMRSIHLHSRKQTELLVRLTEKLAMSEQKQWDQQEQRQPSKTESFADFSFDEKSV